MSIFDIFRKNKNTQAPEATKPQATANPTPQAPKPEAPMQEAPMPEEPMPAAPDGKRRVHNLIILDESGSMGAIYYPALTGVNETIQTIREAQKEHPEQEHLVSLIAFDSGHYNRIYHNTPAEKAIDITKEQYRPSGGTPLFDAMGRSITALRNHVAPDDVVLVTIITDGYENASREYNGRAIKALVEEMRAKNWVFTYIGANQDVDAVAESMSINNRMGFAANAMGTRAMFARENRSRRTFFDRVGNCQPDDLADNYFVEEEEEEEKDEE